MIGVTRLDGSVMYLNEDLIVRVEHAAGGQSAIYMLDVGHIIVANDPVTVIEMIRTEKVELFRRVFAGSDYPNLTPPTITRLSQVRGR